MNPEQMAVLQLSPHVSIGMTKEAHKRGGCYLILALDYAKQEWGKEQGEIRVTLYSTN
jgi:hypothetical protein